MVSKANVDRRVRKAEHIIVALLDDLVFSVTQIYLQDARRIWRRRTFVPISAIPGELSKSMILTV